MLRVLDLFSGIGGFSLGLERTGGFQTVAFCEIEPFPRSVLAHHWPGVPCYDDVRSLTADRLRADGIEVETICGGFPCQDISLAGAGAGIDGQRSGLWREFARLIGEIRPRYVIVENVAALLVRGLERVLGDLAALGFDAEWHCIPASAVGAWHRRDRIWIVAYPVYRGQRIVFQPLREPGRCAPSDADSDGRRRVEPGRRPLRRDTDAARHGAPRKVAGSGDLPDAAFRADQRGLPRAIIGPVQISDAAGWGSWATESSICRVADGVPHRVDKLAALGNAVVPQIPQMIGQAILDREAVRDA